MNAWHNINGGETIGTEGSEGGRIVLDEKHEFGARITLEQGGSIAPWAITCGIYGSFMHTAFASSEREGRQKYDAMKTELLAIMSDESADLRYEKMRRFSDVY